jgi:uncharacterized alpha-E superfamily protein
MKEIAKAAKLAKSIKDKSSPEYWKAMAEWSRLVKEHIQSRQKGKNK